MYFMALAVDYDGTLAYGGKSRSETIDALVKIKASGRKLIMVTGRQLDDLKQIFEPLELFDRIVAENGALIYTPQTQVQQFLADPLPEKFIEKLKLCNVTPLSVGNIIVSTEQPQEKVVLEVIRDMGLELTIIFNRSAVMILPSNVNKATGLTHALKELGLSMHNIIGIGDAENDHAFLETVGLGIAVANSTEAIKQNAGWVTKGKYGQGVEELINQLLENEDAFISKVKHKITLGIDCQNRNVELNPTDRILIAGHSGIGKSTLTTALTEKMVEKGFQFCLFDPEGDYEQLDNSISVGEIKSSPSLEQVIELLKDPGQSVVVNTLGIDLKDRPSFFVQLAAKLFSLIESTGRPHWLIVDEAHHLMPASRENPSILLQKKGVILITVHPDAISEEVLKSLNVIIILGPQAAETLEQISQIIEEPLPESAHIIPNEDEVLIWQRMPSNHMQSVKVIQPKQHHKRHTRKYTEGDLSEEFSFYFRGPNHSMNIRAQNLMIFLQIAEGIDDETWMYHLQKKDYSDWFRNHIKDDRLADAAAKIESDNSLTARQSRQAIAALVRELYTAPASAKD